MPAGGGIRLEIEQWTAPAGPQSAEGDPEQSIQGGEDRSLMLAFGTPLVGGGGRRSRSPRLGGRSSRVGRSGTRTAKRLVYVLIVSPHSNLSQPVRRASDNGEPHLVLTTRRSLC